MLFDYLSLDDTTLIAQKTWIKLHTYSENYRIYRELLYQEQGERSYRIEVNKRINKKKELPIRSKSQNNFTGDLADYNFF